MVVENVDGDIIDGEETQLSKGLSGMSNNTNGSNTIKKFNRCNEDNHEMELIEEMP